MDAHDTCVINANGLSAAGDLLAFCLNALLKPNATGWKVYLKFNTRGGGEGEGGERNGKGGRVKVYA